MGLFSTSMRVFSVCLVLALSALPCAWAEGGVSTIREKTTTLRAAPEFHAEALLELSHGDEVTVLSEKKGWVEVSAGGYKGFIPRSAVSKTQVALSGAPADRVDADSSDVVLAGKGLGNDGSNSAPEIKRPGGLLGRLADF